MTFLLLRRHLLSRLTHPCKAVSVRLRNSSVDDPDRARTRRQQSNYILFVLPPRQTVVGFHYPFNGLPRGGRYLWVNVGNGSVWTVRHFNSGHGVNNEFYLKHREVILNREPPKRTVVHDGRQLTSCVLLSNQ